MVAYPEAAVGAVETRLRELALVGCELLAEREVFRGETRARAQAVAQRAEQCPEDGEHRVIESELGSECKPRERLAERG